MLVQTTDILARLGTERILLREADGLVLRKLGDGGLLWKTSDWTDLADVDGDLALVSGEGRWSVLHLADASVVWTRDDLGKEARLEAGRVVAHPLGVTCTFRLADGAQEGRTTPDPTPPPVLLRKGRIRLSLEEGGFRTFPRGAGNRV